MVIITWDKNALISLESIYKYIAKDSLIEARKVRNDIFKIVSSLINHPERFSLDKYKLNNQGDFRAFEKHKIRVTYFLSESNIRIVRVRHTKMNPQKY